MRNLCSKLLTGAMAVMLIGSVGVQVKANNYKDTYYTATLEDYNGRTEDYTDGRYKADYSSGYVRNISSSYGGDTNFTLVASDRDGSRNYYEDFQLFTYGVSPGKTQYLKNYVKESGYNYVAVKVEPGSQYYMETYFAWSPDNYGGY